MKYNEAEEQIKALSNKYSIDMDEFYGYFNINYKGVEIAFVNIESEYIVGVGDSKYFHKLPFSNKLYMILSELALTPLDKRAEDKKYYIHVFKGQNGYLNIVDSNVRFYDKIEANGFKTKFTGTEIEKLKQREDIPLNWKKVKLEDAK